MQPLHFSRTGTGSGGGALPVVGLTWRTQWQSAACPARNKHLLEPLHVTKAGTPQGTTMATAPSTVTNTAVYMLRHGLVAALVLHHGTMVKELSTHRPT